MFQYGANLRIRTCHRVDPLKRSRRFRNRFSPGLEPDGENRGVRREEDSIM